MTKRCMTLYDSVAAAGAACRREWAGIPAKVRHREKWSLALEMIDEMTRSAMERPGPGHCGRDARPVVAVDIAYGDNALFGRQLTDRGRLYAVAVNDSVEKVIG